LNIDSCAEIRFHSMTFNGS